MKPDDILLYRDTIFGHHRFWEIISVCLGAEKQEGLIELKSLNYTPGTDTEGRRPVTTWVPEPLLRGLLIYAAPAQESRSGAALKTATQVSLEKAQRPRCPICEWPMANGAEQG